MRRKGWFCALLIGIFFVQTPGSVSAEDIEDAGRGSAAPSAVSPTAEPSGIEAGLSPSAATAPAAAPVGGASSQAQAGVSSAPGEDGEAGVGSAEISAATMDPDLEVSVANGLLSVRLKDADLFEVMKTLSLKTGMRIKVDKGASKRITLTFRDLPFDKGIRNLVRPLNNAMVWRKGKSDQGMEVETLEELHVFREGYQGSEAVEYVSQQEERQSEGSRVERRAWSEETRRRMLEKLTVSPSAP